MLNKKLTTGIFEGCFFFFLIMLCLGQSPPHTHTGMFTFISQFLILCLYGISLHVNVSLCLCSYAFLWLFCHFSACLFVLFIFFFCVLFLLFLDVCSFPEEKESTVWFSKGRDMGKSGVIWSNHNPNIFDKKNVNIISSEEE